MNIMLIGTKYKKNNIYRYAYDVGRTSYVWIHVETSVVSYNQILYSIILWHIIAHYTSARIKYHVEYNNVKQQKKEENNEIIQSFWGKHPQVKRINNDVAKC